MSLSVKGNQLKLNAMEVKFIGTKENELSGKREEMEVTCRL